MNCSFKGTTKLQTLAQSYSCLKRTKNNSYNLTISRNYPLKQTVWNSFLSDSAIYTNNSAKRANAFAPLCKRTAGLLEASINKQK